MQRREFVTLFGASAAAWPLAARAQQRERMRRIGMLMPQAADDPGAQFRVGAFLQALHGLGWTLGRNIRIDYRWIAGDIARYQSAAVELVALAPDVVVTNQGSLVATLQQASRSVPIVFVGIIDAVAGG